MVPRKPRGTIPGSAFSDRSSEETGTRMPGRTERERQDMPAEQEVRRRAYELWEQRGRRHGFAHQDWFDAEKEVSERRRKSAA